jgi:hypothetical protein
MKLRVAKKIVAAVGTPRDGAYTLAQHWRAINRVERCRTAKRADEFFAAFMDAIGVGGRAKVLAGCGAPDMAVGLLMRTPVEEWDRTDDRRLNEMLAEVSKG